MKGMIFNEFLELEESSLTYNMVDKIILDCDLDSGGAYTSIETAKSKFLIMKKDLQ
jgi:hypothetical protein